METSGCPAPAGHAVRYCSIPSGTTVTFSEYAAAVAGIPHPLEGIGNERVSASPILGPPRGPAAPCVSATRRHLCDTGLYQQCRQTRLNHSEWLLGSRAPVAPARLRNRQHRTARKQADTPAAGPSLNLLDCA